MRVLVIGLCTLHWGRMEFGNVGNYYIVKPFFEQLRRVFPHAEIATTFQMSEEFCAPEAVKVLPSDLYYSWDKDLLAQAQEEYVSAKAFAEQGMLLCHTPYIDEVLASDLVVDLSGDMWGDNADIAGKNRFKIAVLKDRVAQLLGKKTVMLAGSPGPFQRCSDEELALVRQTYAAFDYVTNREQVSTDRLRAWNFDLTRTEDNFCPAFLCNPEKNNLIKKRLDEFRKGKLLTGVSICGFNFPTGEYNTWPRADEEFLPFCQLIEHIVLNRHSKVMLLSHNNAFVRQPNFQLQNGRDYVILQKLHEVLLQRGHVQQEDLLLWDVPFFAPEVKYAICLTDLYVSGRAHGAVAAFSQNVPCLVLDYLNGPTPQKLKGFARDVGMEEYVVGINESRAACELFSQLCDARKNVQEQLEKANARIKNKIEKSFDHLQQLVMN